MVRLLFYLSLVLLLASCYCPNQQRNQNPAVFVCDAEAVDGDKFKTGDNLFGYGGTQSSDCAFTGKYSAKVFKDKPYTFEYKINKARKGDCIYVYVWRKSSKSNVGEIIIESQKTKVKKNSHYVIDQKNGWELIECKFIVDEDYDDIKVFMYNGHEEVVYFDDLRIEYFHHLKKPKGSESEQLHIEVPQSSLDSLLMFRKMAIEQNLISGDMKKYFSASILIDGKKVPIQLRLKGDWTDHVISNKWSMRIKITGDETYQGMKKFSVQNPSTRAFMLEWFAHKLFEQEDILTTRYQFKVVYLNGENMGVYALEEHFDKRLLENRKRREGPIVKYDESAFWEDNLNKMVEGENARGTLIPYDRTAEIVPFSDGRTRRTPTLHKQFLAARHKMEQYRNRDPNVGTFFDEDKMAKFLAMQDVINSNHGMAWHNQRNYFNPVNNLMEPIGYDCFPYIGSVHRRPPILAKFAREIGADRCFFEMSLFQNKKFEQLYLDYLEKFSSEDYLISVLNELKSEILHLEGLLKAEYPKYSFDEKFFIKNCELIRNDLPKYKEMMNEDFNGQLSELVKPWNVEKNRLNTKASMRVNRVKIDSLSAEYTFSNYHAAELTLIGYSEDKSKDSLIKIAPLTLKAFLSSADSKSLTLTDEAKYFYFKAANCGDSIFKVKCSKWPPYEAISDLENSVDIFKYASADGNNLTLKKGSYTFRNTVYVPSGYRLTIEAGVSINLLNNAGFLSYSPVNISGTSSNRVKVTSGDGTGSGFTVIAGNQKCNYNYADFSNLNTMRSEYRVLTGAVTVYEADLSLTGCTFSDNHCEDGLNIIRSHFVMNECVVQRTYADGFDADFCTGEVLNSEFRETGNDCIDFSGSELTIKDCLITGSGDKGISGGENSTLTVVNCSISGASIGVAAKDFSRVNVSNTSIEFCDYAYAAYRKKPEFGEAVVTAKNIKVSNVKQMYLVELGSRVVDNGTQHVGTEKFDIDSMYAAFSK